MECLRCQSSPAQSNGHCAECNIQLGCSEVQKSSEVKKSRDRKCGECGVGTCAEYLTVCQACDNVTSKCCRSSTRLLPDGTRCCYKCARCSKCGELWEPKGESTWLHKQLPICSKCVG